MSARIKRTTAFNEGLKRVTFSSFPVSHPETTKKLNDFSNCLKISGYDAKYRAEIIKGIIQRANQIEIDIQNGNRMRYRSRERIKSDKASKKGKFINTWFLRGNFTSVLNVFPTPGGELATILRENLKGKRAPDGGETLIVEMGGELLTNGLFKADPGFKATCPFDIKCPVKPGVNCLINRVVYEVVCKLCAQMDESQGVGQEEEGAQNAPKALAPVYRGHSACSLHKRLLEHISNVSRGGDDGGIAQHFSTIHPDIPTDKASISACLEASDLARKVKNMERAITEGYKIEEVEKDNQKICLNRKSEWGRSAIRRLGVVSQE